MENVYKHTGFKDWENGLFYENINLLMNRIARRPKCGHPSKQELCFSISVVHGPIYGRFMGFYVNGFLSIYKIQN